jgi:soluble lytic murein transglycosylase
MRKWRLMLLWLGMISAVGCNLLTVFPSEPTSIPTITFTPIPSLTPTSTQTPTPTITPIPTVRISTGDHALLNGDYARARDEYNAALTSAADAETRAAALWGLGRAEYYEGNYGKALDALRDLTTNYPGTPFQPFGYFFLGQTYTALTRYQEAADAYSSYIALRPGIIASYVQEKRGDLLTSAGNYEAALSSYQLALDAPHTGSDEDYQIKVKIGQSHVAMNDPAIAIGIYDDIANTSDNDYVKAQMDFLAGQAYLAMGQKEMAYTRFRHTVVNYPLAYDSYSALVALVDANQQVDDLNRGLVDYFAGQYNVALAAFNRHLEANPENDGTAHYYRALILRDLGNYQQAVDEFTLFIDNYRDNRYWASAWDDKAYTQWYFLEQYTAAAQTLDTFVASSPGSTLSAGYLREAGRILERAGQLSNAVAIWERVADQFPSSDQASESLFQAGIARYRLGDFAGALTDFQRTLILSTDPSYQAQADLWIGKTQQKLGDTTAAQAAWQLGQSLDPTGYYSERARDLLLGRAPFDPPSVYNVTVDLAKERSDAEAWVRVKFNLPPDTDLTGPGPLLQDQRLWRGTEFWELGLYDQARIEFEDLRNAVQNNPTESFRLGNYLLDLGVYRSAIFAIRQVLTLAGLDEHAASLGAPPYFSHVRYGFYYGDLVTSAAEAYGFHPLFLISVIRQESLFEGFVHSTAGARGLMQIVPATGATIASMLSWPNYTADDLYRPLVSIDFGAHYLDANRNLLGKDLYAGLAAYNGGPANAAAWKDLAGDDPDLFLEVVRFEETRNYIRGIYEIYTIYRSLYSPAQ